MTTQGVPATEQAVEIADLRAAVAERDARIAVLEERIKDLERRMGMTSQNSSRPPSLDGFKKRAVANHREKTGRKPGGQRGHEGRTLRMVEEPDRVEPHRPAEQCPACQASLLGIEGVVVGRRQMIELPVKLYEVIEHQVVEVCCPGCQAHLRGSFPDNVKAEVQYGPGVRALATYLQAFQLLPSDRIESLLSDVFGLGLCEGTLDRIRQQCATGLAPVEELIKDAIIRQPLVHFDETGVRIAAKLNWLHSAGTRFLTHYAIHPKRGREAQDAIGILPKYTGTALHDEWLAYFSYADCEHSVCQAHHSRELVGIIEQGDQSWAEGLRSLLFEMKAATDEARARGDIALDQAVQDDFASRYDAFVRAGKLANPIPMPSIMKPGRLKRPKVNNLLNRLSERRAENLRFMTDLTVPFDNNLAERDLRMMKVKTKVSGGFRSKAGADDFCRIRGYISTLRKQGLPVLGALRSVFTGQPLLPALG